jgi:dienelactone hydrolase
MKKASVFTALAVIILIVAPVLYTQLIPAESRSLQGPRLAETSYREIEFPNRAQNIELAGMLFVPRGEGPFSAAVVIHGSGTSRRDNRWYLSLARYLQDNGVAVLLPDKRGSEKSGGNWRNSSFQDLASDTLAAIGYLREQEQIDVTGIGVVGMSQGGWIAPIVARQSSDLDFLVSVVGAAVTSDEQLMYEENLNLRQMGFLPGISNVISHISTFFLRNFGQKEYWEAVGNYDPLPYWKELSVRALALYGRDDSNVPTDESAARLRSLDNPNIEINIYEGSGHALEDPAGVGDALFREDALRDIRDFIGS